MTREPLQYSQETEITFPKEKRHLYDAYTPPANRPFRKRKVSTFNILLSLLLLAVVSVLYVSNIIAVNQLVVEVEELKMSVDKIENMSEILRSEINRKSSMERITRIATDRLGMQYPKQPPIWLEIDEERLQELTKD